MKGTLTKRVFAALALVLFLVVSSPVRGAEDCSEETFNILLKGVCPSSPKETESMIFYEDVRHPQLTVEAIRKEPTQVFAGIGPSLPALEEKAGSLLKTVDLMTENYFHSAQNHHPLEVHYSPGFPMNGKMKIVIYVCNDSNGDGRCSDESAENQLTPQTLTYAPCHLPKVITVPVWAGCR